MKSISCEPQNPRLFGGLRLATEGLLARPEQLKSAESLVGVARERFDYPVLAGRVLEVLERVLRAR